MNSLTTTPNRCVVLGIDPGRSSGWAIMASNIVSSALWENGTLNKVVFVDSGVCKHVAEYANVYSLAVSTANEAFFPLVVGRESWTPGWTKGKRTFKSIVGTGAAWGRWQAILESVYFPKSRIFSVASNEWRKHVLSLNPGKYTREQAKRYAITLCRENRWFTGEINHDAAEATLVAYYMLFDSRVFEAIRNPSRLRKL